MTKGNEMTKHKPATLLPWDWRTATGTSSMTDLQYIAHAANAYPKLVEALQQLQIGGITFKETRTLLMDLGEFL